MEERVLIKLFNVDGRFIFQHEEEGNTIAKTIKAAVKAKIPLKRADLRGTDLSDLLLCNADMSEADFTGANLSRIHWECVNCVGAKFDGVNMTNACIYSSLFNKAIFSHASIKNSEFILVNFFASDFAYTDICSSAFDACICDGVKFDFAKLSSAYFHSSKLTLVDFSKAKEEPYVPISCPSEGAFIGWKTVRKQDNIYLIKLLIPEDALRCSAAGSKCRCSKAKVLSIENLQTHDSVIEVVNTSNSHIVTYKVGEEVIPDMFDENRWNESSHGIHFFVHKQGAINYVMPGCTTY